MKKRLHRILLIIGDDATGRQLIGKVLSTAIGYVQAVATMESELLLTLQDEADLRVLTKSLDDRRTAAHNALIDALNSCTRYLVRTCPECNEYGLYPEPIHLIERNRRAIGDWAGKIVQELFVERR